MFPGEFKESSMGLQGTIRDASGRSRTEAKRLIRKRRVTSRSATSPCQGGSRGFDPSFPLQTVAPCLRGICALWPHRRASRPDAASIARLIPRKRSAPAAGGSSLAFARETPPAANRNSPEPPGGGYVLVRDRPRFPGPTLSITLGRPRTDPAIESAPGNSRHSRRVLPRGVSRAPRRGKLPLSFELVRKPLDPRSASQIVFCSRTVPGAIGSSGRWRNLFLSDRDGARQGREYSSSCCWHSPPAKRLRALRPLNRSVPRRCSRSAR